MGVTLETFPQTKNKAGNVATRRSLEVSMRFDVTGGSGSMTATKLTAILNQIVIASREALEAHNVDVSAVDGQWAWVYGPWFKGSIS